jgi:xanthine dehydrogenase YagS FAD-binding subunit
VTHPFLYRQATSIDDAARQLGEPGAVPLGGGTDLLVTIAEELSEPDVVVDLRTIGDGDRIDGTDDGGVRIGAATRIADIARNRPVRERFPALAQACDCRRYTRAA